MRSPRVLIAEFASLTTPYCWVITEDAVAGYDGARAARSRQVRPWLGPGQAAAEDVAEALTAGRFFRLVDGKGRELAIGRLYDPSGESELAPVDEFGRQIWARRTSSSAPEVTGRLPDWPGRMVSTARRSAARCSGEQGSANRRLSLRSFQPSTCRHLRKRSVS